MIADIPRVRSQGFSADSKAAPRIKITRTRFPSALQHRKEVIHQFSSLVLRYCNIIQVGAGNGSIQPWRGTGIYLLKSFDALFCAELPHFSQVQNTGGGAAAVTEERTECFIHGVDAKHSHDQRTLCRSRYGQMVPSGGDRGGGIQGGAAMQRPILRSSDLQHKHEAAATGTTIGHLKLCTLAVFPARASSVLLRYSSPFFFPISCPRFFPSHVVLVPWSFLFFSFPYFSHILFSSTAQSRYLKS